MASVSLGLLLAVSRTLLYRELERLTGLGWVGASRVAQPHAPNKVTYRDSPRPGSIDRVAATAARDPGIDPESGAASALLRAPDVEGRHQVAAEGLSSKAAVQLDELLVLVEKLEVIATPAARSGRIVAQNGVATTRAQLEWALDAERQLIGDTETTPASGESRTALVVGGTGMLGAPVVRRLVDDGLTVRRLVRREGAVTPRPGPQPCPA